MIGWKIELPGHDWLDYLLLLLLLLKVVGSAGLGESDLHTISPKTPTPQCQHKTERREREK